MSFTVNDVILRASDYVANYSTGQSTTPQKIRAVDASVNYIKRLLGFPQDERKASFLYTSDNFYYNLSTIAPDYQEPIGLYYDDPRKNNPKEGRAWEYRPYTELLPQTGNWPNLNNQWSTTPINGSWQLLLLGSNQLSGQMLETFDQNVWSASGDASNAHTDVNIKYQGVASEAFNITYSTGQAILTSNSVNWDFITVIQNQAFFNAYAYFPSTNVTSVEFRFQSSAGNYYSMVSTTKSDGTAWTLNQWNKITWSTSGATIVGSPNIQNINELQIIFNIPVGFGTVPNFRIDDLYYIYPDLMDFIYSSNIKGTNSAGSPISTYTSITDIITYDDDFIEPISLYTALYIQPQLRANPQWYQMYQQNFMQFIKTYARSWPKKRLSNNYSRAKLQR